MCVAQNEKQPLAITASTSCVPGRRSGLAGRAKPLKIIGGTHDSAESCSGPELCSSPGNVQPRRGAAAPACTITTNCNQRVHHQTQRTHHHHASPTPMRHASVSSRQQAKRSRVCCCCCWLNASTAFTGDRWGCSSSHRPPQECKTGPLCGGGCAACHQRPAHTANRASPCSTLLLSAASSI